MFSVPDCCLRAGCIKDAETELRQGLSFDPQDAYAHSLLAVVLSVQKKLDEALQEATTATRMAANAPYSFYALAMTLAAMNKLREAVGAIKEAIRLDPRQAHYYGFLSDIYTRQEDWQNTLRSADEGLSCDPQDVGCTNSRAIALVHLDRRAEAGQTIAAALAREPENAVTHANQGWTYLHLGDTTKAMEHFREALRLNPNLAWAQSGIVEALKARNPIYRVMLAYFLWMSRLSPRARWGVVIGVFITNVVLMNAASTTPGIVPILNPIRYLIITFALLTWTASSLFDLLLRFDPYGRLVLSRQQITATNWVALCIAIAAALFAASLRIGGISGDILGEGALRTAALLVPVSTIFWQGLKRNGRIVLIVYTVGLAGLATIGVVYSLQNPYTENLGDYFWIAWVVFTWVANGIVSLR